MEYSVIKKIAEDLKNELAPYANKIAIAGSIRREEDYCNDVEIVAVPKRVESTLFDKGMDIVLEQYNIISGKLKENARHIKFIIPEKDIKVDLFLPHIDNYYNILVIRTGPTYFSEWIMTRFKQYDCRHAGGYLLYQNKKIICNSEEEFFSRAGVPCVAPNLRNKRFIHYASCGRADREYGRMV